MNSLAHHFLAMARDNARSNHRPPTADPLHAPGLADRCIGKATVGPQPER